ncbi:oleate-induced peroxisomal protein [Metarhizium acridum CQMa 102]|uniref:Oleate-induced peroxisomal protein n=1 Tax=Metarhizium acridum (strain CQMa 102) TaxID=655827 RepID=E9E1S7_METAQ|nr:oleate-induced peroxisomal protein [Metarhizium acridum CQMa 102]EFY90137.1 oleate-induced peroxisomal protein [Metarhizium acridum CQMa 102]
MGFANAKFPASAAFDVIDSVLSGSDAERKDAIKQANGVFAFTLKNKAGETESWHVDLKESGRVGTGVGKPTGMVSSPPPLFLFDLQNLPSYRLVLGPMHRWIGGKRIEANSWQKVTLLLSEEDFGKLVDGSANPQRLFMSGKLKIKGDIMKATKLDPIMKKAKSKANL